MAHLPEFVQHRVDPPGADEQHPVGQPAGDLLGELLAGEQLLGEHRVLGQHQADAAVQLDRQRAAGVSDMGLFYARHPSKAATLMFKAAK